MMTTLRNRNFFLLWFGGLISMIGSWMLLTALPFHIYAETGSALATSALLMSFIAPGILFGSIAGVFVDRWDRKRVLVIGALLQAVLTPLLLLSNSDTSLWIIYAVMFANATISQFLGPAENALLPTLVDESQLVSANSLNALNDNVARIVGAALGGVLLGVVGFHNVVIFDAVSFLVAAIFISLVIVARRPQTERAADGPAAASAWATIWQEWLAGLKLVRESDVLRGIFIVAGVALFGDAILSALLAVFAQDVAGFSATEYGWILTARGVGGILGGLVIAQFGSRLNSSQLMSGGLVLTGLIILVMVLFPTMPVVLSLMVLGGPALMAWIISVQTALQQATEDRYRGRVFGAYITTSTLLMFVGSGLAGALADTLGTALLMTVACVIYVIAGAMIWPLLSRPLGRLAVASSAR